MFKRLLISITFFACLSGNAYAASTTGTAGAQFLKINSSAKHSALGETGAVPSGVDSIFANPAGLNALKNSELTLSHVTWLQGLNLIDAAYAKRFDKSVWGFSINYLSVPAIDSYDNTGTRVSDYSAYDMAATFAFARSLSKKIDFGVNAKYISSKLESHTASAFAADLGFINTIKPGVFSLGLVLQNFGTPLKYISASDPLPWNIKLGSKYVFGSVKRTKKNSFYEPSVFGNNEFDLFTDLNYMGDTGVYGNLGLQVLKKYDDNIFALRAGFKTNSDSRYNGLALGLGFDGISYVIDYSYSPLGELGQSHRISLTFKFGLVKKASKLY